MADTPPWQRSKQPDPPDPSQDDSWGAEGKAFLKSAGKGAVDFLTYPGIQQAASDLGHPEFKQWVGQDDPNHPMVSAVGRAIGGSIPTTLAMGPEGGLVSAPFMKSAIGSLAPSLSDLAKGFVVGGTSAFGQGRSGSLSEDATTALEGGTLGAVTEGALNTARGPVGNLLKEHGPSVVLATVAHHLGVPWEVGVLPYLRYLRYAGRRAPKPPPPTPTNPLVRTGIESVEGSTVGQFGKPTQPGSTP